MSQPFGFQNIDGEDGHESYIRTPDHESIEVNDIIRGKEVLTQFTSLHDINGKEIYEGDIVRGYGVVVAVRYQGIGFFPFTVSVEKYKRFPAHECEVIGNIYETPELLQQPT